MIDIFACHRRHRRLKSQILKKSFVSNRSEDCHASGHLLLNLQPGAKSYFANSKNVDADVTLL